MTTEIPLSHASLSEVCTRVAYRCIRYFYFHTESAALEPEESIAACAYWLEAEGFTMLSVWVRAYRNEVAPLMPVKLIRENHILRARLGHTWRRVAYPSYKSGRR